MPRIGAALIAVFMLTTVRTAQDIRVCNPRTMKVYHRKIGTPSAPMNNRTMSHSTRKTVPPISFPRPLGKAYGPLPLSFEPNLGQADASVKYLSHGAGYALFLTGTEAALSMGRKCQDSPLLQNLDAKTRKRFEARKLGRMLLRHYEHCRNLSVRMAIDGANSKARVEAIEELPGKATTS